MPNDNVIELSKSSVEAAAKAEIRKELEEAAKRKLVVKLREIAAAKKVVENLEAEYQVVLRDLAV